jgi:hypothetical protein
VPRDDNATQHVADQQADDRPQRICAEDDCQRSSTIAAICMLTRKPIRLRAPADG